MVDTCTKEVNIKRDVCFVDKSTIQTEWVKRKWQCNWVINCKSKFKLARKWTSFDSDNILDDSF